MTRGELSKARYHAFPYRKREPLIGLEKLLDRLGRKRVWLWLHDKAQSTEADPAIFEWRTRHAKNG